jgi:hypothetical protein
MRKLMLVPMVVILFSGVQSFLSSQTYAKHVPWHCCTAGMCDSGCYCCNQSPFCRCVVSDPEAIESQQHEYEGVVDIRQVRELRPFNIANSNFTLRLRTMMATMRVRGNLKLLDGYENGLKVWCPGIGGGNPF